MNARRRKFAHEYVKNGFNGVQAVFAAGYNQDYDSACVEASRLLRNAKVRSVVEKHLEKSEMDASEVIERLSDIARADIADVLEPDGSFNIAEAQKRGKSKLIKSLKFDKDTGKVIGLETYSAHEGQRDLGKIHKLFVDRVETEDKTKSPAQALVEMVAAQNLPPITLEQAEKIMAASVARAGSKLKSA